MSKCGSGELYNDNGTLTCPCKLSDWVADGECVISQESTCGEGLQKMKRAVYGGKCSPADLTSMQPCLVKCPNCFQNRTAWSSCDKNTGLMTRITADLENGLCKVAQQTKECSVDCVLSKSWGKCLPDNGKCGPGKQTKTIITKQANYGKECGRRERPCKVPCKVECKAKDYIPMVPDGNNQTLYSENASVECASPIYQPYSAAPVMMPVLGTDKWGLCGQVEKHTQDEFGAKYVLATRPCDKNDPRQLFSIQDNIIKSHTPGDNLCMYAGSEWEKGWSVKFGPCESNDRTKYFGNNKNNKLYSTLTNMCIYNNNNYAIYDDCALGDLPALSLVKV